MTYKAFLRVFLVSFCFTGFLESQKLPEWAAKDRSINRKWNEIDGQRDTVFKGKEIWDRLDNLIKSIPPNNDPESLKNWRRGELGSFDHWFHDGYESLQNKFIRKVETELITEIRTFVNLMYTSDGFRTFLKRHWNDIKFLMASGIGVGIIYYLRKLSLVCKEAGEQDRVARDRQHADLVALREAVLTDRAGAERTLERHRRRRTVASRRSGSSGERRREHTPSDVDEAGEGNST